MKRKTKSYRSFGSNVKQNFSWENFPLPFNLLALYIDNKCLHSLVIFHLGVATHKTNNTSVIRKTHRFQNISSPLLQ